MTVKSVTYYFVLLCVLSVPLMAEETPISEHLEESESTVFSVDEKSAYQSASNCAAICATAWLFFCIVDTYCSDCDWCP